MDLTKLTDTEVLGAWVDAMDELKRRGLIRSSNNPIADLAERLVAERLGLTLAGASTASYDAIGPDGIKYQIKARRLRSDRSPRQLSPIRNFDNSGFDFLVVVLFGERFDLKGIWQLPIDLVREHAKIRPHVNGHILHARSVVLNDPRAKRIA